MSSHAIVVIVTPSPEDQIPVFRVGLTTLTLTRAHCKFWLCSECWKALSRDRFTKMIFQIGSSLQGSEEIYCPVTMPPGNKRHCQQEHSPPLPQQVSTSVPSQSSPDQSWRTRSQSRHEPHLYFLLFHFATRYTSSGGIGVTSIGWLTTVTCHGRRYYKQCVLRRSIRGRDLDSLDWSSAPSRERECRISVWNFDHFLASQSFHRFLNNRQGVIYTPCFLSVMPIPSERPFKTFSGPSQKFLPC